MARATRKSTPEPIDDIYDFPRYYDIVFTAGWREEIAFLEHCFAEYTDLTVQRVLEPACGTGRLAWRLAKQGYDVAGVDLNPHAVRYCNRRLVRHGFSRAAIVADMARFTLEDFAENQQSAEPFDAGFNLINSFRHLITEETALNHLQAMAAAIRPGGLYLLGLHLLPEAGAECEYEEWVESRGGVRVLIRLQSVEVDPANRHETITFLYEIDHNGQQRQLQGELNFRTYSPAQFLALIKASESWEIVQTYDFHLNTPVPVMEDSEDVVFVLRRIE
ncbi:MAG: class I SAM-dependent methyltransferase [Pirellulaceae bacterium]